MIIGAGVIGLTTGVRLAERGLRVLIYKSHDSNRTSSYAAGAIFDPYMAEHRDRKLRDAWALATRQEFERLHAEPEPWARLLGGVEASRRSMTPPEWALELPGYQPCANVDLPPGFASGWRYRTPLIEMPRFIEWLETRLSALKAKIEYRRLTDLRSGFDEADIVVNCTGIGAGRLVPDDEVRPIRGQLVAVPNPGIHEFFVEHVPDPYIGDTTYVLPHDDVLLLGGSAELGTSDLTWDHDVERAILSRCRDAFPALAGLKPIEELRRIGIRPHRPTVRLDHEDFGDRHIVHNYGHGGSGVSLSWGCADEVAKIVAVIREKAGLLTPAS